MFKQLAELVTSLIFLARDTRENKEAISQLRREMDELTGTVDEICFELRRISEREKFVLRVENALLRFERLLPSTQPTRKKKR